MGCEMFSGNCNNCKNFVRSTNVIVSGTSLVIVIPQNVFSDGEKVCVCVSQAIPFYAPTITQVAIQIGTNATLYNLVTEKGEFVSPSQIKARRVYHLRAAATSQMFRVLRRELCGCNRTSDTIPAGETA